MAEATTRKLINWHKGNTSNPLYSTWQGMIIRCKYPSSPSYKNYGGRGIRVVARWLGPDGLTNFSKDMGPKPTKYHTLDRIDNNGNYEPGNCRWATRTEQVENQRPRGDNSRNTSGYRNIYFDKTKQAWRVAIQKQGKRLFSNYFKTLEEAQRWREKNI